MPNNPNNRHRVYGPQMRDQSVPLFTELSSDPTSPLMVIRGKNPVITAYNLPSDAIIWIEMVELTEQTVPWREGCCVKELPPQQVISVNRIRCTQCTADTDATQLLQYARITTKNPVIELNLPYGTYWQLRWDGPGIGEVFVRVWESSRSFDASMPTVTNGCPCIQYIDDPEAWIPNNVIRCNETTGNVEGEFRDPNNNQTAWFVVEPILWRDTGATREYCNPATPVPNPASPDPVAVADESYEKQQINQCGYVRWVNANCMYWTPTGNDREYCDPSDTSFERQMINQFGRFRWDNQDCMVWNDTGEIREYCDPLDDAVATDDGWTVNLSYERQQVNQFGRFRWVNTDCMVWSDTGKYRAVCPDTNDNYEKQQVNQFGRFRWIDVDCVNWTDTGRVRESSPASDTEYEIEQSNQYGGTQWVTSTNPMVWEDTGVTRELFNLVEEDPPADPPNPPTQEPDDELFEKQQINNLGRLRWIEATVPMLWSETGKIEALGADLGVQEKNQFGRTRWNAGPAIIAPVLFVPYKQFGVDLEQTTTVSVASDPAVEVVTEVTPTVTAVTIEKGYGFIAGDDTADPDATVLVAHPVTAAANAVAIYPTPRANATVEVFDTLAVGARTLLGYARNNPLGLLS